jgi:hypothetical protein
MKLKFEAINLTALALILMLSGCGGDGQFPSSSDSSPTSPASPATLSKEIKSIKPPSPYSGTNLENNVGDEADIASNSILASYTKDQDENNKYGSIDISFRSTGGTLKNLIVDTSSLPSGWSLLAGGYCPEINETSNCVVKLSYINEERLHRDYLAKIHFGYENGGAIKTSSEIEVSY